MIFVHPVDFLCIRGYLVEYLCLTGTSPRFALPNVYLQLIFSGCLVPVKIENQLDVPIRQR